MNSFYSSVRILLNTSRSCNTFLFDQSFLSINTLPQQSIALKVRIYWANPLTNPLRRGWNFTSKLPLYSYFSSFLWLLCDRHKLYVQEILYFWTCRCYWILSTLSNPVFIPLKAIFHRNKLYKKLLWILNNKLNDLIVLIIVAEWWYTIVLTRDNLVKNWSRI